MDKINNEINNITQKHAANKNDMSDSYNNSNNINNNSSDLIHNGCDANCKCDVCLSKANSESVNNNFQNYQTVSFKNNEQVDIVVEHDKKQACCVIYNNNCLIF